MGVSKRNSKRSDRKTVKIVKKTLNNLGLVPEMKFSAASNRDFSLAASGTWVGLADFAANATQDGGRIGNEIAIKKIEFNFTIDRPDANLNLDLAIFQVFYALVLDKQPNESNPTIRAPAGSELNTSAIFSTSTVAAEGFGINAIKNPLMSKRYTVLKSGIVNVGNNTVWNQISTTTEYAMLNATSNQVKIVHIFKKPLVVKFNGTPSGVGEIVTNNLGIAFLPSTDETMGLSFVTATHYTDC